MFWIINLELQLKEINCILKKSMIKIVIYRNKDQSRSCPKSSNRKQKQWSNTYISEDTEQADQSLERAVDSAAESFRSHLESRGCDMLNIFGLQRVRYKVTEESNNPKYGIPHFSSGKKAGMLESASLKYYNVEDDYELRLPHVKKRR